MTAIFFDRVTITSQDSTASRIMLGGSVSGLNVGSQQVTLPRLIATAYLKGVALSPQPSFKWFSSNPCVCAVDQNGNCTRVTNPNASSFDSNGGNSTGQLGGLVQIRAVALRPDGSESGVEGVINVTVQAAAAHQWVEAVWPPSQSNTPRANNSPSSSAGFYNLVS